jgi:hypothetical protein
MNSIHTLAYKLRLSLSCAGPFRKPFPMRLPAFLFALTLGCSSALADGVKVIRLLPEYMPAEAFDRVSEYFTHQENTRGATIIRTQPGSREGFYFNLRAKSSAAIEIVWIELQVITPASPAPRTESFAMSLPKGSHLIRFGLTGKDWPGPKARPVAWKIRLLATDGAELATEQSFLWSKPAKTDAATPAVN